MSTTYCYLDASGELDKTKLQIGCVGLPTAPNREPTSSAPCKVDGGATELCALGDNHRGVDADRWLATYAFDHCEDVLVYVRADGEESHFCKKLATTGDWSTRRRESAGGGVPESDGTSWWSCGWWWSGTRWHDGKCRDKTRFLGETCWDDAGECYNEGVNSYSGLHMSCATVPSLGITSPTCLPSAFDIERNSCSCGWFDWYVGFACGAADGACNGHACVWSTGSGEYSCDYNTENNW